MKEEKPIIYTIKFAIFGTLCVLIILLISFSFIGYIKKKKLDTSLPVYANKSQITVIVDAGHGGEDGGAVANDGTLEKNLNLQISKLLCALYELNGTPVKATREEDILLYDYYGDLNDYGGYKKMYDIKNRLKITTEYENPLFISIHMNKFTDGKYSGLQVYYSKNNAQSELVAKSIQDAAKRYLQPTNNRAIKAANSSIFILDNIKTPAVLVECGFLSNHEETEKLKSSEYQAKLALILFASSISFCTD